LQQFTAIKVALLAAQHEWRKPLFAQIVLRRLCTERKDGAKFILRHLCAFRFFS